MSLWMKPDKNREGGKHSFNQHRQTTAITVIVRNTFQLLLQSLQKTTLLCVKLPSSVQIYHPFFFLSLRCRQKAKGHVCLCHGSL